jgi:tetratricopeptide (TPR) repeat protein
MMPAPTGETAMSRAGPYGQSFASKYLKEGKYEQAREAATEAIELDGEDPDNYLDRAQSLLALERFSECVDDIALCLEKNREAQSADEDVIDDVLFSALVDWGKSIQKSDPEKAVALLQRYQDLRPGGAKLESLAEWTRWFRGENKVLIKNKL